MSDPTRTTGATPGQIEAAVTEDGTYLLIDCARCKGCGMQHPSYECGACGGQGYQAVRIANPDQCIVPRSFVAAVDAAISEAEELDYSPPYIRIPIGRWHDVENARDTFREGTS